MSGSGHDAIPSRVDAYRALDAGCGSGRPIPRLRAGAYVVGLDFSAEALHLNDLIDERIVGDVETYPLEPCSFDEVFCWYVLEHLPRPQLAFANLAQALKPGGALTIGVPNLLSVKVLVTKFTPLSFHAWAYRRIFPAYKHVGEHGFGPWKTHLHWTIRPRGLERLAAKNDLEVESLRVYEADSLRPFWDLHPIIRLACRIVWPLGNPRLTECELVARKRS